MFAAIILSSLCVLVNSYPGGPPLGTCQAMKPKHGTEPQTSTAPYTITTNATSYSAGSVIEVTIQGTSGLFLGVFVQARKLNCDEGVAVGTFSLEEGEDYLQLLDCNKNSASAVGHSNRNGSSIKTFYWTAPAQTQGHLYFRGTFVQTKPTFWMGVNSTSLKDPSDTVVLGTTVRCGCGSIRGLQSIVLFSVIFVCLRAMII